MRTDDETSAIRRIWLKSPGKFFCISVKSISGAWRDNFFERSRISEAIKFAKSKGETHNVYMCPHGFSSDRRHKDYAIDPYWLYADLDECDPKTLDLKPTIAIESSPGRYVGYWLCDKQVPEELNQRLAYHIGADNSGWDRTQVLRVPGTKNLKYKKKPSVKILWSDGPQYEVKRLEKLIPALETGTGKEEGGDAAKIYEDYEKDLPRWVRKELTNPKVQHGKRSEVLWKLINELLEVGMSKDEVFTVLWDNEWNKHSERRGGERQLEREIEKATGRHVTGGAKKSKAPKKEKESDDPTKRRFTLVTMDQVVEEQVDWIVEKMLARGQTGIWEGDPGIGKSYFLMYLCIHLCDGLRLPWEEASVHRKPMKVLYCDMENAASSVTKVRLTDNGLKNHQNYAQFTEPFSVDDPESIEAFRRDILEVFRPDVVVIDPVNLYIGGADTYRASETQQALQVLKDLSEEYNFSLNIVRHLNKSSSGKALYAGNGSIAFAGVARIIATVGWHPEEADVRVVACTKNNLSPFFGSLGYTIEALPETLGKKNRSQLSYYGHVDYASDDIVGTANKKEDGSKNIAADLIREMLKDGEVNYYSLLKNADTRSISELSIRKAAAELGLRKISRGRGVKRQTFLVEKSSKDS
jgi:hypothetical protein